MVSPKPGPSGRQPKKPPRTTRRQRQQQLRDEEEVGQVFFDPFTTYCEACDKNFSSKYTKMKHVRDHHQRLRIERWTCFVCHEVFDNEHDRLKHFDEKHQSSNTYYRSVSALSSAFTVHSRDFNQPIERNQSVRPFEMLCSSGHTEEFKGILRDHLKSCASFKASLIVTCLFSKDDDDSDSLPSLFPLRTHQFHVYQRVDMDHLIHRMLDELNDRLDNINVNQTGWRVVRVSFMSMVSESFMYL